MIDKIKKGKEFILVATTLLIIITSFTLGIHNATLYNPDHGFDGSDHVLYIKYINKNWKLPPANWGKEYHQSPLYYVIGAILMTVTGTWKMAQYINIFILWMIIGMVGIGLWKVFKKWDKVLIGMLSLVALPMLNIFSAMITNELLNTFWVISIIICSIFVINFKNKKEIVYCSGWFIISFVFGYWTKVSIIIVLPIILIVYLYIFLKKKELRKIILIIMSICFIVASFSTVPIFFRAKNSDSASNIIIHELTRKYTFKSLSFYFRLDWIPKVDMYNTQYYSLIGAAWNSFWTDGHNAITPFVAFHKKSFVLWSLGFILLPICIYGFLNKSINNYGTKLVLNFVWILMLLIYINNNLNGHYSGLRLTYEMGIVVPYAFGIAGASQNKKLKWVIVLLLSIQFIIMVSFFWILPWWHVTK